MDESADRHRPRRARVWAVVAAVAFVAGIALIGHAASNQGRAPQPAASAAGRIPAPPARPSVSTSHQKATAREVFSPPADTTPGPGRPVEVTIPAIGVRSPVVEVGLNPDGTIETPKGADYDKAAWYRYSPRPGAIGPSIIEGHVDSKANGPSVFYRLGALRPGDLVDVALTGGTVSTFRVDAVRQYPKAAFPTGTVYGDTTQPALRLITCGGSFDPAAHSYRDNIVVFASFVRRAAPAS
ncbi:MAG: class F sortase [Actinobacteria bacterium]|nr:class F sortase [Actinomycetota bacterium]